MNKNPYEIRLDVMKMAQEMLDREADVRQNMFFAKLETLRSQQVPADEINKFIDENAPRMYNTSDVVERSSALYNFVTSTKPTNTNKP